MAPRSSDSDSQQQLDAFLGALRRSADIAQELLRTTEQQVERIRSLEKDLESATKRNVLLEQELSRLRGSLGDSAPSRSLLVQLDELVDEQNCLAHLFVTSDRLARVRSADEALGVAAEVMHNLVGAHRFGFYFRFGGAEEARLLSPRDPRQREGIQEHDALVAATLGGSREGSVGNATGVPVCQALRLDGATVGALLITELTSQVGPRLGRLQVDLIDLLADRLASSMCVGALHTHQSWPEQWRRLGSFIDGIDDTPP